MEERTIEDAMRRALPPFIKVLRTLIYLRSGEHIDDRDRLIAVAAEHFEISGEAFAQLMAWRREELHLRGPEWREAAAYFLDGLEKVIQGFHG